MEEEQIYRQPEDYDLEHAGYEPDIGFFMRLVKRWAPRRVLELACGSGRVTIPLAEAAGPACRQIIGLDGSPDMLAAARQKSEGLPEMAHRRLCWIEGDIRSWKASEPLDLVVCPCASMSHLLSLEDQLMAWRQTYDNLVAGGRFVVAELMANLPVLAESVQIPPRAVVEIDGDSVREQAGSSQRLVRYRSTQYYQHEQRASIRFLYDKFVEDQYRDHFLSDYDAHVFFPREMQLLFRISGFQVEAVYGDYQGHALGPTSRHLIMIGKKP